MASEAMPSTGDDLRKRRSTRVVQAVPLTVTGVDALGRPFAERTSSLVLNCHGCRYQSKHYVLKNMWITLEVPSAEADRPPRSVRGRVAWIQRPRTVRQLFQVALELEHSGNVWGIQFPPEDWFPAAEPEKAMAAAAAAGAGAAPALGAPSREEDHSQRESSPASEPEHHSAPDELAAGLHEADNVRVFPSPASGTDASMQLARQVTRLVTDARQQIQATVREVAAQAVAAERRIGADQVEERIAAAREELSRELTNTLKKFHEESSAQMQAAHDTAAQSIQQNLAHWLAPQIEEITHSLREQISQYGQAQQGEIMQGLAAATESTQTLVRQAEETNTRLREGLQQAETESIARAEAAIRSLQEAATQHQEAFTFQSDALTAATKDMRTQIQAELESAQAAWQRHLNGELQAAQTRNQIALDNAVAAGEDRFGEALNARAEALAGQLQRESEKGSAALLEAATLASADIERRLAELSDALQAQTALAETALGHANEAYERTERLPERLEFARQQALGGFQSQVDDLLILHRNELHRRSESLFDEVNARIRSTFDDATRQAVANFHHQIEAILEPHVSRADEAVHRLAGGRALLDAALTLQQDRIRASADEAFGEALAEFRGSLGGVEQLLREAASNVTSQSLGELEAKTEALKHQAVDDMLKSAEWYEKKAQTQIQTHARESEEKTEAGLREKAAEVLRGLATDLENFNQGQLTRVQSRMDNVVQDGFDRARGLFAEAADTTTAAFIDEIQRHARQELEGFDSELQVVMDRAHTQAANAQSDLSLRASAEQEQFLKRFRAEMGHIVDTGVTEAHRRIQGGFEPLLESWKSMIEAHQRDMQGTYSRLSDQSVEHYSTKLENITNQWMLATAASLDHQSRRVVSTLAANAEEQLREKCSAVFANIGDVLRERLQQITSSFAIPSPAPPASR
jgi:hypothetical protein